MINTDRVIAVTKTDLISLYGLILTVGDVDVTALAAVNPAEFELTDNSAVVLASEPVATFDFGTGVSAATVYFVPAYDYAGFTVEGAAATVADNDVVVNADGASLYKAVFADSTVTITQVGF